MKTSMALLVLGAFLVAESLAGLVREPFECRPGMTYIENECNSCYCISGTYNELVCTLKKCPENKEKDLEKCAAGSFWAKDCNKCWCVNNGEVCTNRDCNSNGSYL